MWVGGGGWAPHDIIKMLLGSALMKRLGITALDTSDIVIRVMLDLNSI